MRSPRYRGPRTPSTRTGLKILYVLKIAVWRSQQANASVSKMPHPHSIRFNGVTRGPNFPIRVRLCACGDITKARFAAQPRKSEPLYRRNLGRQSIRIERLSLIVENRILRREISGIRIQPGVDIFGFDRDDAPIMTG